MTATYCPITLDEMKRVLRAEQGWTEITPFAHCKEHVFQWALTESPDTLILVYSSIEKATGVSRKVGGDAIRVCAVKKVGETTKGWIKSTRVHRVDGWAVNLRDRCVEVIHEARARNGKVAAMSKADTTTPQAGLSAVIEKLDSAHASGLKYPKLRFEVDGQKVVIARVASGINEGKANVTDGGPYGANIWFGRIEKDGSLRKGAVKKPEHAKVAQFLEQLGGDVLGVAKAHGHATGNCTFCGRGLTTAESVTAGYGPICAAKWSLPWGHVDPELASPKKPVKINTEEL